MPTAEMALAPAETIGKEAVFPTQKHSYPDKDLTALPPEYDDAWIQDVTENIGLEEQHIAQWADIAEQVDTRQRFVREYLLYHLRLLGDVPLHGMTEIRAKLMNAFNYERCRSGDYDED